MRFQKLENEICTVSDVAIFGQMAIYGQIKVIGISTKDNARHVIKIIKVSQWDVYWRKSEIAEKVA